MVRAKHYSVVMVLGAALAVSGCEKGSDTSSRFSLDNATPDSLADPHMALVLARVGDIDITGEAVRQHMLKRTGPERVEEYLRSPDILQVAMSALVDQYVWAEIARREGVKLTETEVRQLLNLESQLLSSRYVADVIEHGAKPSREDVEAFYNENQARYLKPVRVGIRHIVVGTRAEAEAVQAQLEGGAEFGELVRRLSTDEDTKNLGGALGFLSAGKGVLSIGRDRDFEKFVLAMDEGQLGIVKTPMGFHVVKAEKKDGGGIQPLEEVYQTIADGLLPQRFGAVYNERLAEAREATNTRYITENFEAFTGTEGNTKRLLDLAVTVGEPEAKAEAYRRIAYDFPDAAEAPEALFRMSYVYLVEMKDKMKARNGLSRLNRKHKESKWRRAGQYLLNNIDSDPGIFGSPEEILAEHGETKR